MNKTKFRLLIILMSFSLIGIIAVQLYWINGTFLKNDERFKDHAFQVMEIVAEKLNKKEMLDFYNWYNKMSDSLGKAPKSEELKRLSFNIKNPKTNEEIIYSSSIISKDYGSSNKFFDKNYPFALKNYIARRKTEVYNSSIENNSSIQKKPSKTIIKEGGLDLLDQVQFDIAYRDIVNQLPIQYRVSNSLVGNILSFELNKSKINIPYQFAIFKNGKMTEIRSDDFSFEKCTTFSIPILLDIEGNSDYNLLLRFPTKSDFVFSSMFPMTILSILFTLIIVFAYGSAIKQLITQKQISEIKSDFINNMTHEFKTPIATINLALDAIKNPKVIENAEMVKKYLGMIKEENKRLHAQVENVLRISRLEKRELDIEKHPHQTEFYIDEAIDHVELILQDKNGKIEKNYTAEHSTILLNEIHFTNLIVNILDNAIKYCEKEPLIKISTYNFKNFIVIRIEDNGIGMGKVAQKKVFEKFYREHTGNIHNVKGHGLGLAYVKQIVDDLNGEITLESEKNRGTTFYIKIPLIF